MSEMDLIPEHERHRVGILGDARYVGLLEASIRSDERIGLATTGWVNGNYVSNQTLRGAEAVLMLTDKRLLCLLPRKKSLLGKLKAPSPIELGFDAIFDTSIHPAFHYMVAVNVNQSGLFRLWILSVGSQSAPEYAHAWWLNIRDFAEAHGGTSNRPPGRLESLTQGALFKPRGENRAQPQPNSASVAPFPRIDVADVARLHHLLDAFEAAPTIAATEAPARELAGLSNSAGWDDARSIWIWFSVWCEQARSLGSPLTAVKIAEFTQTYHERFIPVSGTAWLYLGKATDSQRATIENAAFDACGDLDPDMSLRADMELPITVFRRYLSERLGRPIDHMGSRPAPPGPDVVLAKALAGDKADKAYAAAAAAAARGDVDLALPLLDRAARLGHVAAMNEAGNLCSDSGRTNEARFWFEAAAAAGHGGAMYNLGGLLWKSDDRDGARHWFRQAAAHGQPEGFGALVGLADEANDDGAAADLAQRGAIAGDSFCMVRHAVALSNTGRVAEALEWEERAARLGSVEGMVNAGISNETLGNRVQAKYWFGQAAEAGDARGHRYLLEYEVGGAATPATRFLRVWTATYEVDAATSTHTSRTVSGDTRDDVLATALRRTPPGSRLVYMCREDDFEATWTEADGFTPKADEPHEFRPPGPRLFKDLAIGDHFRRGYTFEQVFQKVDERHARNTSGGAPFEMEPYDGAY